MIAVAQFGRDLGGKPRRRSSARRHRADQRHGDRAAGIDRVGVGETFLAIDHDPQFVAGIEPVRRVIDRHGRGRIGGRCGGVSARGEAAKLARSAPMAPPESATADREGRRHAGAE